MAPQRYPTAGGMTVTWQHQPGALEADYAPDLDLGNWKCSGCNKDGQGEQATARAHAAGCRESAGAALLVKAFGKGS